MYAATLSDSDSSNSESEESCDREGSYSAFMTIAHVESSNELNFLERELGKHSDEESLGVVEESDVEENESTTSLQENYNSLLEKSGEYTSVRLNLINHVLALFHDKFACNIALRNLVFRWESCKGSV